MENSEYTKVKLNSKECNKRLHDKFSQKSLKLDWLP